MLDIVSLKLMLYAFASLVVAVFLFRSSWYYRDLPWHGVFYSRFLRVALVVALSFLIGSVLIVKRHVFGMLGVVGFVVALGLTYLGSRGNPEDEWSKVVRLSLIISMSLVVGLSLVIGRRRVWKIVGWVICAVSALSPWVSRVLGLNGWAPAGLLFLTAAILIVGIVRFAGEVNDGRRPSKI